MVTFIHAPDYAFDWGAHVFPVEKYALLAEDLRIRHGLVFLVPEPATFEALRLVHTKTYLTMLAAIPEGPPEFDPVFETPVNARVVAGYLLHTGGTVAATYEAARTRGCAMNLGGGFHHAFANRGQGFCLVNDVALAARLAVREGLARRIAIVDCDVHQGNGTAGIFSDDPTVFTFSIHQEHNYPIKEQSDLDIGLEDGTDDDTYLAHLEHALREIEAIHDPDFVFYLAGADPYREDRLGGLALTQDGLRRRDQLVLAWARQRETPTVILLAGGYATSTADVVAIHAATADEALRLWP